MHIKKVLTATYPFITILGGLAFGHLSALFGPYIDGLSFFLSEGYPVVNTAWTIIVISAIGLLVATAVYFIKKKDNENSFFVSVFGFSFFVSLSYYSIIIIEMLKEIKGII